MCGGLQGSIKQWRIKFQKTMGNEMQIGHKVSVKLYLEVLGIPMTHV